MKSIYKTMSSSYCLKCRKNTECKNPKVARIKKGKIMIISNCVIFNSKKSKQQGASGILSTLGIIAPLGKITLVSSLLF